MQAAPQAIAIRREVFSGQDAVEPALPGHTHRPLEGVTPKAARGCSI